LLFLSLMFVGIGTYKAKAFKHQITQMALQGPDRLVWDKSRSDSPVKITLIKTKKRVIENDKKLFDDDDWLQGLTLRVTNHSDRTITYVGIQLIFRRTEDQESGLPAGWPLNYGIDPLGLKPGDIIPSPQIAPIPPGGEAEITLGDTEYREVEKFLGMAGFPANRKRLELDITVVGFSDETIWNSGHMFRRDPGSLKGPLKGWSAWDDPVDGKQEPERSKGSASNRAAFFIKTSFNGGDESPWHLAALSRTAPRVSPSVECGEIVVARVTCGNTGGVVDYRYDEDELFNNPYIKIIQ
jgi:hypothetical protein